jgi:cytochrome c oxidase accessory protein FixG
MVKEEDKPYFRDTISTSKSDGGRKWLYPEVVKGKWFWRRAYVAYFLLACLLAGPFLEWDGHPIFLFDVLHRTFIVFGIAFSPQDNILFVLGLLTFTVFILAFTNTFGRLWCGWACPQTIFMEWVFRPIESFIEGNANARKKLDEGNSEGNKSLKKGLKYLIYFVLSFGIANVFLAYLIGKKELLSIVSDNPSNHWAGLSILLIFTLVFLFVFARLREIACVIICPYGRLQGTIVDKNSLAVSYDLPRGEPRGHQKANQNQALGDCLDCNWCVKVCPTGIDIRNGIQMECIQCTACIDACNQVMEKVKKPLNLVGFFSENEVFNKIPFRLRPKGIAYFGLWLVLISVLSTLLFLRTPIETVILRTPGNTGIYLGENKISNLYNFEAINKTFDQQLVHFKIIKPGANLKWVGKEGFLLPAQQVQKGSFFIEMDGSSKAVKNEPLKIEVWTNGKKTDEIKTKFFYQPSFTSK